MQSRPAHRRAHFSVIAAILLSAVAVAGPPFRTDDPQPVDFGHWEFYIASQQQFTPTESDATCPHVEINYGVLPDVQLHVVAPLGYVHSGKGTHYGYSDTEVGVKYRFVGESDESLQVGSFPLIEIPTGNAGKELGNGSMQAYLPVWIQKSWGDFTTYGGAGVWYNPGAERQAQFFAGWEFQEDLSRTLTLGGEIYDQSSPTNDSPAIVGATVGGIANVTEAHHILFSFGRMWRGQEAFTGYIAYQITF